jgi:hypothetical protein
VDALVNANFSPRSVGALVANERQEVKELMVERKTIVGSGAALGVILGAALGVLTLAGVGLISLGSPGEALQGAAAGAALGFFAGALGGLGYWTHVIDFPDDAFRTGAVLVGVVTHSGRVEEARRVLTSVGADRTHACSKDTAARRVTTWVGVGVPLGFIRKHWA